MRLIVQNFDPSHRDLRIQAPVGSRLINLRMSVHGHCQAVILAPDQAAGTMDFRVVVLQEDQGNQIDGDPDSWAHVGSWRYMGGSVAHGFIDISQVDVSKRKRRIDAYPIDGGAATA